MRLLLSVLFVGLLQPVQVSCTQFLQAKKPWHPRLRRVHDATDGSSYLERSRQRLPVPDETVTTDGGDEAPLSFLQLPGAMGMYASPECQAQCQQQRRAAQQLAQAQAAANYVEPSNAVNMAQMPMPPAPLAAAEMQAAAQQQAMMAPTMRQPQQQMMPAPQPQRLQSQQQPTGAWLQQQQQQQQAQQPMVQQPMVQQQQPPMMQQQMQQQAMMQQQPLAMAQQQIPPMPPMQQQAQYSQQALMQLQQQQQQMQQMQQQQQQPQQQGAQQPQSPQQDKQPAPAGPITSNGGDNKGMRAEAAVFTPGDMPTSMWYHEDQMQQDMEDPRTNQPIAVDGMKPNQAPAREHKPLAIKDPNSGNTVNPLEAADFKPAAPKAAMNIVDPNSGSQIQI
eukprot:TRINITY_DN8536_c1_g1_i3.p1 TRINITY_DN8536_c1_g1~~TRINITY_DN8536_c1_g1_i3.p1  ORF type:complete len:391 (+),score=159.87 TRINITY_DN8536_c1_g1_i3:182-1354(+)